VLSYAEVKALCAGDDRIKEKMDLEVEVAKLRLLKSEYQSTQYQLEDRLLKRYPEQIKKKEAQIAGIEVDQKTAEQHPKSEDNFVGIEVLGILIKKRREKHYYKQEWFVKAAVQRRSVRTVALNCPDAITSQAVKFS